MDATERDLGQEVMDHNGKSLDQLHNQLQGLYQNLRTVRHAINNNVAVIMAMAELSQRNPAQSAKLSQLCLEKAPQISSSIGSFVELFEGIVALQEELDHQLPAR